MNSENWIAWDPTFPAPAPVDAVEVRFRNGTVKLVGDVASWGDEPCPAYQVVAYRAEPTTPANSLPDDADKRREYPMADGLLDYFPNALAEVSRLSFHATQQHHPNDTMHWDRSKSLDHRNKIMRHLVDAGGVDGQGMRHSAMVAWRALALLQEELERELGLPPSRASRNRLF